jgi:DNA-binding response OmpR family regulator
MRNAGRVVTRERAMELVWDEHWFGSTKTLDVHIAALRQRLGEDGPDGSRISTLRGVGYRLEVPKDATPG